MSSRRIPRSLQPPARPPSTAAATWAKAPLRSARPARNTSTGTRIPVHHAAGRLREAATVRERFSQTHSRPTLVIAPTTITNSKGKYIRHAGSRRGVSRYSHRRAGPSRVDRSHPRRLLGDAVVVGQAILPAAAFQAALSNRARAFLPIQKPAESRLRPGLAAPQFVPNLSESDKWWSVNH